uniref:Uncharacterized protein n=1 Tax=Strigamia maritima TaxID=126957 RepID=T1IM67_STRMM
MATAFYPIALALVLFLLLDVDRLCDFVLSKSIFKIVKLKGQKNAFDILAHFEGILLTIYNISQIESRSLFLQMWSHFHKKKEKKQLVTLSENGRRPLEFKTANEAAEKHKNTV